MTLGKNGVPKLIWLFFWPLGIFLSWVTSFFPSLVEGYYTQGLFKALSRYLSLASGVVPFSLAEVLAGLLAVGLLFGLAGLVRSQFISARRRIAGKNNQKKKEGLFSSLYKLVVLVGIVYFSFILVWGLNYNRLSFAEIAGLNTGGASDQELEELCNKLIVRANELRSGLKEDGRGVLEIEGKFQAISSVASLAFTKATAIYPELRGDFGRPKPVFFSKLMSYTGISGIYFPFTGEANVNVDIPDSLLPATTCHEMAHQRGFAREDEANYIAWVVCNSSDDLTFRYSGTLSALIYAMNALYESAPDRAGMLREKYSGEVRRDLLDISRYWKKYEGRVEEVTSDINDAYLKSNRQEEGVQSYGRMVDLLLAEQKAEERKKFL